MKKIAQGILFLEEGMAELAKKSGKRRMINFVKIINRNLAYEFL